MFDYYEVFKGPGINELRLKPPWAFVKFLETKESGLGKMGGETIVQYSSFDFQR